MRKFNRGARRQHRVNAMLEYSLVGLLILFLIFLFLEVKRKAEKVNIAVNEQKRSIADDSGMTASIGVFSPDVNATVVIGASEEKGLFYYRMLRQTKVIVRSRINLANLAKVEFLVNGAPYPFEHESEQPTAGLRATDISDRVISRMSADSLRQIQRAGIRVIFYDESGGEKTLEITAMRGDDERHKFDRVKLLKNAIWWVAFLQMTSRQARRARAALETEKAE